MSTLIDEAYKLEPEIIKWRRWIHQHAEVGMELPDTASYVEAVLDEIQIPHTRWAGSGVVGIIGQGERSVLLRADMDALPEFELSDLPYASKTQAMHACGHDMHIAMLLGAAKLLKKREGQLCGRTVLMFQPGEECMLGAKAMIDEGLISKYKPECAFTMHVNVADVPAGDIWIKQSTFMAASDNLKIAVKGRGGHGAHPHNAVNPIYAAIRIIDAFTDISRYETSTMIPNILTICNIESGKAANVIPDFCTFKGTLRTLDKGVRERILKRLEDAAEGIAAAYNCTADFSIISSVPCTTNNAKVSSWAEERLIRLLGRAHVNSPIMPSMGSEDFAYISELVPSCYMSIGTERKENGRYPLHNNNIIFDEGQMHLGSAAFATLVIDYFNGNKAL